MSAREIKDDIRTKSWSNKSKMKAAKLPSISVYKILEAITKPKDWLAIATKCSQNEKKPEYFGRNPEDILKDWRTKGKTGANRGSKLDEAIQYTLATGNKFDITTEEDEIFAKKYTKWYEYYSIKLKPLDFVGAEMWLSSTDLVTCRLDALFAFKHKEVEYLLITDWKNNEHISFYNSFQNFRGPAAHLEESDINKFTIQLHIYQYILEQYGYTSYVRLVQSQTERTIAHQPAFKYDREFVKSLIEYAHGHFENEIKSFQEQL